MRKKKKKARDQWWGKISAWKLSKWDEKYYLKFFHSISRFNYILDFMIRDISRSLFCFCLFYSFFFFSLHLLLFFANNTKFLVKLLTGTFIYFFYIYYTLSLVSMWFWGFFYFFYFFYRVRIVYKKLKVQDRKLLTTSWGWKVVEDDVDVRKLDRTMCSTVGWKNKK